MSSFAESQTVLRESISIACALSPTLNGSKQASIITSPSTSYLIEQRPVTALPPCPLALKYFFNFVVYGSLTCVPSIAETILPLYCTPLHLRNITAFLYG